MLLKLILCRYDLPLLTEDHLQKDIGIRNSIHRKIILDAVAAREAQQSAVAFGDQGEILDKSTFNKNIDAFISYRRSNGSQLARYAYSSLTGSSDATVG